MTHTWANVLKRAQKVARQNRGQAIVDAPCEICTKLMQIRRQLIFVHEMSIKGLICTLKEASCKSPQLLMLNNEWTILSRDSEGSILLHKLAYGEIHTEELLRRAAVGRGKQRTCRPDTRTPFIILMWPKTGADRR